MLVGGAVGILLGGAIADRLGRRRRLGLLGYPGERPFCCPPRHTLSPCRFRRACSPGFSFAFAYALSLVWLGPISAAVQGLVLPRRRATASACFLLFVNLIGLGFGTFVFGFAADRLRPAYGAEAMRYAMLGGLGFYVLAALLCAAAAFTHRDRDAESSNI